MTKITIVDDRDPQLKYTGSWVLEGANGEFDQTSHGSTTLGSQVTFTFHGTSIAVVGTIQPTGPTGPPKSNYTIDSSPTVTFTAPSTTTAIFQVVYYESPTLENGEHTLIITDARASSPFWIDYILYTRSPAIPAPLLHSSSSSIDPPQRLPATPSESSPTIIITVVTTAPSYPTTSSSAVAATLAEAVNTSLPPGSSSTISTTTVGPLVLTSWTEIAPSQTQNVSSNDTAGSASRINVGAIAGGAAGAGVLLAAACGLLYYFFLRRRHGPNYPWGIEKNIFAPDMRMPSLPIVSDEDLAPSVFDLDSYNESLSRNSPANANNHETVSWVRNNYSRSEYATSSIRP
ncbi:hypothetical protein PILCRDRAFT_810598 [Piloderma croceum F 1598]|uniref:Uncharacterized protein n=1 Tax=Piloderma croceum (strain F 1598) TaxID=765440 RepID=A0A0C3BXP5_PILCF|nr:hypothetical protein PILCRDRAFT_810598 [Piloderma croceum F 1598]